MSKEFLAVYAAKDTVPPSSTFTPTMTTVGVHYTLSVADTTLAKGDWVYDAAQDEVRQVLMVESTTTGRLTEAFSSDLTADTIKRIAKNTAKMVSLSIAADKGGNITVDGVTVASGTSIVRNVNDIDAMSGGQFVTPAVVDGSTNNATVAYRKF